MHHNWSATNFTASTVHKPYGISTEIKADCHQADKILHYQ